MDRNGRKMKRMMKNLGRQIGEIWDNLMHKGR